MRAVVVPASGGRSIAANCWQTAATSAHQHTAARRPGPSTTTGHEDAPPLDPDERPEHSERLEKGLSISRPAAMAFRGSMPDQEVEEHDCNQRQATSQPVGSELRRCTAAAENDSVRCDADGGALLSPAPLHGPDILRWQRLR